MKEETCFVALDFEKTKEEAAAGSGHEKDYALPDG
jgi:hypothetical protein